MTDQYSIERHGHRIKAVFDDEIDDEFGELLIITTSLRLFIDGRRADERSTLVGEKVRLRGSLTGDGAVTLPIKVEVEFGLLGEVKRCVLIEDGTEYPMSEDKSRPKPGLLGTLRRVSF